MTIPLIIRKTAGYLSKVMRPGVGSCQRCNAKDPHLTPLGKLPVCDLCLEEITQRERVVLYVGLINMWLSYGRALGCGVEDAKRQLGAEWAIVERVSWRGE